MIISKERGITMIALIITIVILIILAGISMQALIGEQGIITKAQQAKENMELAQTEEQKQLNILYSEMVNALETSSSIVDDTDSSDSSEDTDLQNKFDTLKAQYDALQAEHTSLQTEHSNLQTDYDTLQTSYSALEEQLAESKENEQTVYYLGSLTTGGTIDVTSYSDYENFTLSNFLFNNITGYVQSEGSNYGNSGSAQMSFAHSCTYTASTGILKFGGTYMNFNNYSWRGTGWLKADVYLVTGTIQ